MHDKIHYLTVQYIYYLEDCKKQILYFCLYANDRKSKNYQILQVNLKQEKLFLISLEFVLGYQKLLLSSD